MLYFIRLKLKKLVAKFFISQYNVRKLIADNTTSMLTLKLNREVSKRLS